MDADWSSKFERKLRRARDPNGSTLLQANRMAGSINHRFHEAHIHPEKLSPELKDLAMRAGLARMHPEKLSGEALRLLDDIRQTNIHPEKMSPHLRRILQGTRRFEDDDGEWLLVESDFADTYMAALAALLAKETDIATLTNEEPSMAVNLRSLLEDVSPSSQSNKTGALVSFMMETIRIDPKTRVDRLLAFRRSREDQLAELSAQFEDISSKIGSAETAKELKKKVGDAYTTRVRPKLTSLKKELKDSSIQSVWDGMQRAVTMTIPAGGLISYFSQFSGTMLLAASAAIAVTDLAVKTHLARNKVRRASPFTYLLDVEKKFSRPD